MRQTGGKRTSEKFLAAIPSLLRGEGVKTLEVDLKIALGLGHLLAPVHAGFQVDVMAPGQLTGGRVFLVMRLAQFVVRTAHAPS